MLRAALAVLVALLALGASPAEAQRRAALVIGIAEYRNLPGLVRPTGDARAVRDALAYTGFEAELVLDPDGQALREAFDRFVGSLREGDTALVHFSGHAARIGNDFKLLAADAPPMGAPVEELRRAGSLGLSGVADDIRSRGARAQVIVVDACRGDPYQGRGGELGPSSCGEAGGQMPEGTFVLFSASAGQKALDRLSQTEDDPHSVFTRVLIRRLPEVRSVVRLARTVRDEVVELTESVNHAQRPAYLDELVGAPALLQEEGPRTGDLRRERAAPQDAAPEDAEAPPEPSRETRRAERPQGPREEPAERGDAFRCGSVQPGPPAFSCRGVRRLAETAICRDPRLGSCDRVLNEVFEEVQARAGDGARELRREEDAWLERRNACADLINRGPEALATCIGRAYDARIAELERMAAAAPEAPRRQARAPEPAPAAAPSSASGSAPSFDCRSARSPVEKAVCSDPVLAAMDRRLARLYAQAGGRAIEAEQDAWRARRDACARDADLAACASEVYDERIRELQARVGR